MTSFWSVAAAVERFAIVYNIEMIVLNRMGLFCSHDEATQSVLVREDYSKKNSSNLSKDIKSK